MNPVVTVFIDILRLNSSKPSQRHKALDNGGTDIGQELENVEKQELSKYTSQQSRLATRLISGQKLSQTRNA